MNSDLILTAVLQGLGYSALAIGVYLSLRIFNIPDITTDGSYTLGGAITAVLLVNGISPSLTLPAAFATGMVAGALTGMIHTKLRIHPLLAGILVMTALYSINLRIMGRSNIPLINGLNIYSYVTAGFHIQVLLILTAVTALLILLTTLLLKTDYGIAMRATGNSEPMVRAAGVNTGNIKITGLALANGLTALSGSLITQYQGFADINMGLGIVISGLGSVMIGEALIARMSTKNILTGICAAVFGSILFRIVIALALSAGLDPNLLKLVTAVIVLLIVALSSRKIRLS